MPSKNQHVDRLITVRYWVALGLIALFVTASFVVLNRAIEMQRDRFDIVEVAAQQRMSSQRIAFLANALATEADADQRQQYRAELRRTVREMQGRHDILSLQEDAKRIPPGMRSALRDIFYNGLNPFKPQVDRFLQKARALIESDDESLYTEHPKLVYLNITANRILETHKLIVRLMRKEAIAAVSQLKALDLLLWLLILFLLVVEVPLIFRPMAQRTKRKLAQTDAARLKAEHEAVMAESAREGQASFIRTMSHELRTPLNAILGMVQLLRMNGLRGKQDEYVQDIQQAGESLLELINGILEFSRLEAKQVILENVQTSVENELGRIISMFRPLAEKNGLALTCQLDPNLAKHYWADGTRIRQVLTNLVGNAIKFTSQGSVSVRALYSGRAGQSADLVRFEVEDTGIGVAPDVQERIFEEFQQADTSLARKYGGTGLGLAISSRLVQLMNGNIGVESAEGKGSVFWFTLPLERINESVSPGPDGLARSSQPLRLHVIVAEEDAADRLAIEERLIRMGHAVTSTANAPETLCAVKRRPPDVVLVGVGLPGMDGLRVTHAIRSLREPAANTLIIAMKPCDSDTPTEKIVDYGADLCLNKPLDFEVLQEHFAAFSRCGST